MALLARTRSSGPFRFWTGYVTELTGLQVRSDIMEPYINLMNHLDMFQFSHKMANDSSLWASEKLKKSNEHMHEESPISK